MAAVFAYLEDYEISLNERIAEQLKQAGLTLRNPDNRQQCIDLLKEVYMQETRVLPDIIANQPEEQEFCLVRPLYYGEEWELFTKLTGINTNGVGG